MLAIRKDADADAARRFVVELSKKSYPPAEGRDRDRKLDDEGAVDTLRCRMSEQELLAVAREAIRHLSQDHVNELVERRLYAIWESAGLSIPWGRAVTISGNTHRLIPEKKET